MKAGTVQAFIISGVQDGESTVTCWICRPRPWSPAVSWIIGCEWGGKRRRIAPASLKPAISIAMKHLSSGWMVRSQRIDGDQR